MTNSLILAKETDKGVSESKKKNSVIVGLLDHMGYGNLGDAAIQDSVISNIKKRMPNARLIAFSLFPEDTTSRHGIPCYPILRWSPTLEEVRNQEGAIKKPESRLKSAIKRARIIHIWAKPALEFVREILFLLRSYGVLRKLDLLIISGGGQLGELWRGPWAHPYTIFKFSFLAKIARKKLIILNVGAGPLSHPLSKFFVKWAVESADYRSFRDEDSRALIQSLGVKSDTHVYPDPAYALDVQECLRRGVQTSSRPIVGINPIGFCDPRIWPRKDAQIYDEYLSKIARFSEWLLDRGFDVRVFTTEISVDRYAIEDLRARLSQRLSSDILTGIFRNPSLGVNEVLLEMSNFDFIVTSKFHGIIFSHLLRIPVISLSYHRKMDFAMQAVGQAAFCADIKDFDTDWLNSTFDSLVGQSAKIKSASAAAVEVNAAKLSTQFDTLFGALGQRCHSGE